MYNEENFVKFIQNTFGVKIQYQKNSVYLVRVMTYKVCKRLFDRSTINWCIARSESHWNEYITKPENNQYFIVDFGNIDSPDSRKYNYSLIGFTINKKGDIYAAHARNDDNLLERNFRGVSKFETAIKEKGLYDYIIKNKMKDEQSVCSMLLVYALVGAILLALCSLLIRF